MGWNKLLLLYMDMFWAEVTFSPYQKELNMKQVCPHAEQTGLQGQYSDAVFEGRGHDVWLWMFLFTAEELDLVACRGPFQL